MSIFKYFTREAHARAFMNRGAMLLRPLSYFRDQEDGQVRGDARDGLLTYMPAGGLVITKQDGTVLTLKEPFTSSAKCDDIFVFCASNLLSAELAARFDSPFCVEVTDPERLIERLRRRADRKSQLDYAQLLGQKVDYRKHDKEPGVTWALPEQLAFIKPVDFAWQDEFRIAIGRRGAFDVENVECAIGAVTASAPAQTALTLQIGDLADFARLHTF